MRAAIYARYSTDMQDRSTSIGAQIENCMMLAKREGFTVDKKHIYQDNALSGAKADRPGYLALKKAIKRKEIDVILANETSRLTRVTSELVALGELLQQQRPNKQHLVTYDGIDTRADGWEWLLLIKAGVDSQERRKVAFRTCGALRQRHQRGNSAGGKAYGYTHAQDGDYRVKVIPEQAKIVKRIFKMYADGMSHRKIAHTLNDEGIPSPGATWNRTDRSENSKRRDGKWVGSTVYAMLRTELYRGDSIWNRAEFYLYTAPETGKTTPKRNPRDKSEWMRHHDEKLRIVPEDLWDRCQKRIQQTKSYATRHKNRADRRRLRLFDLECTECGARYVMVNWKQLGCSTNRGGGENACSNSERINQLEDYRAKVAALATGRHGLGAHEFAKAKALIAKILGSPVPVDANGVARLDLARMVVAGARCPSYTQSVFA